MKKWIIALVIVSLLAGGMYLALGRANPTMAETTTTPGAVAGEPVTASNDIIAEAIVVPDRSAALSLAAGGIVTAVPVAEGDVVEEGQLLVQLDSDSLATALSESRAALAGAEARLAQTLAGASAEDVVALDAAVAVAATGVRNAESAVATARANLARVQAPAAAEEIAIAQRRVEVAKNALWGAQAQRDAACGRANNGGSSADCDAGQAATQRYEEEVRIAELQLQQLQIGATAHDIAAAQAQVNTALAQLETAQAQVLQAEAERNRAVRPATAEEVAIAESQVEQAKAAVARAEFAVTDAGLRAPFAGAVVKLDAKVGEYVAPAKPLVHLADLSAWRVETTDLTELSVVRIKEGDRATITFDALPGVEIPGTVTRINALGVNNRGDITYTAVVTPDTLDARLRWNMTASVTIEPAE